MGHEHHDPAQPNVLLTAPGDDSQVCQSWREAFLSLPTFFLVPE